MSVPTSRPPYGKPRFGLESLSYDAQVGDYLQGNILNVALAGAPDETPFLGDDLIGRPARLEPPNGVVPNNFYGVTRITGDTTRIGVTAMGFLGNNWYRERFWFLVEQGSVNVAQYLGQGGSPIYEAAMPGNNHWLDRVGDTVTAGPIMTDALAVDLGQQNNTEPAALGEFVATQMLDPDSGISHSWIWGDQLNLVESETQASTQYTTVRGPARRRFSLEQSNIPAESIDFWQRIIDHAGEGRPFVYFPPEFGAAIYPRIITDTTADWIVATGNADLTIQTTGHDPAGSDALRVTPTGGFGVTSILTAIPVFDGPEDWSRKWLRIDVKADQWAWLDASTEFFVRVYSHLTDEATTYDLSQYFVNSDPVDGVWYRFYIDFQNHPDQSVQTTNPADLTRIQRMELNVKPDSALDVVEFCNIMLIDPKGLPAWVKMEAHTPPTQEGDNPLRAPSYGFTMQMLEVIA